MRPVLLLAAILALAAASALPAPRAAREKRQARSSVQVASQEGRNGEGEGCGHFNGFFRRFER
jgi:hypothetical protein